MKLNKLLNQILNENSTSTYSYGCVMLYFDFPEMESIHSLINENDVYYELGDNTYGLEDEPHCTLLYGLHDIVTIKDVESILDSYTYYTCKVHNPSLFQNENYDVLKFEVKGDNLFETNEDLKKLPHTSSYPNYNPHLTVGYIKSGRGIKYVKKLNETEYNEFWLHPSYAIYSQSDGTKTKINIKVD